MKTPADRLAESLPDPARTWFDDAKARAASGETRALTELFPQLPRRLDRAAIGGGRIEWTIDGEARAAIIDLDSWRRCDLGADQLLRDAGATDDLLLDLYHHGDLEERAMVFRCLAVRPITAATLELLGEAQRTNTVHHFEAAICDNNLLARALDHDGFTLEDFNRVVLKLAFIDLPLRRAFEVTGSANAELSRMLQGLATEREAAGRAVWRDTARLIARAPTNGTLARLIGHLEHGDDGQRLAAVEGLIELGDRCTERFLQERRDREPRDSIRSAIERALDAI